MVFWHSAVSFSGHKPVLRKSVFIVRLEPYPSPHAPTGQRRRELRGAGLSLTHPVRKRRRGVEKSI